MGKFFSIAIAIVVLASCSTEPKQANMGNFGDTSWSTDNALNAEQFMTALSGKDSLETTVSGEITAACQTKGCWMTMDMNGTEMIVKFKDYGFFVPMNSAGHKATMKGWAYVDTLSVAEQQEYARDAEKSEEEIAAITEPQVKLSFMADGVIIE
jgi:hypothetical protein